MGRGLARRCGGCTTVTARQLRPALAVRVFALVACIVACGAAFAAGRSGGVDLGHASAAGVRAGFAAGVAAGRSAGYRDGYRSGRAAGFAAEYPRGYAQRPAAPIAPARARSEPAGKPAPDPAATDAGATAQTPQEAQIRDCTNAARAAHGLPALADDPQLDAAAHAEAANMLRYRFFDHTDPWGRGIEQRVAQAAPGRSWTLLGENIAGGQSDPAGACSQWMTSPGHRANILDAGYVRIGTGFAAGATGYGTYYVEDLIAP